MNWFMQILVLPLDTGPSSKSKYECNFFNNTDLAYVPASGLFDFVSNFNHFAPKTFKKVSDVLVKMLFPLTFCVIIL